MIDRRALLKLLPAGLAAALLPRTRAVAAQDARLPPKWYGPLAIPTMAERNALGTITSNTSQIARYDLTVTSGWDRNHWALGPAEIGGDA